MNQQLQADMDEAATQDSDLEELDSDVSEAFSAQPE